jgi:hypothetical protein
VVGPDLRDVDKLCCIHAGAPKTYVKPDEKHGRVQSSLVVRSEILCSQGCFEDERYQASTGSNEQEWAAAKLVDVQGSKGVAEDGERCPASVEEEWYRAREAERGVDEHAVVGEHEDLKTKREGQPFTIRFTVMHPLIYPKELIANHENHCDERSFLIRLGPEDLEAAMQRQLLVGLILSAQVRKVCRQGDNCGATYFSIK